MSSPIRYAPVILALTIAAPIAYSPVVGAARAALAGDSTQPSWTAANRQALENALAARDRHGLDRVEFLARDTGASDQESVYTKAAVRYAAALAHGIADPKTLHNVYTLPRPEIDVEAGLAKATREGRLAEWLDGLAPQDA